MRKSITQELEYGCGVACFAYVCDITFQEAVDFLGKAYSVKHGWKPSDLVKALKSYGLHYKNHYVRKKHYVEYTEGSIVLIERSSDYPFGHYLVFTNGKWMDPWVNLPYETDIRIAESGYRLKLPGKPMYALVPSVAASQ